MVFKQLSATATRQAVRDFMNEVRSTLLCNDSTNETPWTLRVEETPTMCLRFFPLPFDSYAVLVPCMPRVCCTRTVYDSYTKRRIIHGITQRSAAHQCTLRHASSASIYADNRVCRKLNIDDAGPWCILRLLSCGSVTILRSSSCWA